MVQTENLITEMLYAWNFSSFIREKNSCCACVFNVPWWGLFGVLSCTKSKKKKKRVCQIRVLWLHCMMGYGLERTHIIECLKRDVKWNKSQQEVLKGKKKKTLPLREIQISKINSFPKHKLLVSLLWIAHLTTA